MFGQTLIYGHVVALRPSIRWLGLLFLALSVAVIGGASARGGSISASPDLTGTWKVVNTSGPGASGTLVITNGKGGAFNGTGFGSYVIKGSVNGSSLHFTISDSKYISTVIGTVDSSGTRITYSWSDTSKPPQKGTAYLLRQGSPPPATTPVTTTGSTTTTATTTTPLPPNPQVCVSIWTSNCAGVLPPPPPVQTCVSLWQDCSGFGGTNPASPPTLNLSTDPSTISTPVGCQESSANPYTSQTAVPPVGGGAAGSGAGCSLAATVDASGTAALDNTPEQVKWDANWTVFDSEVHEAVVSFLEGSLVCYHGVASFCQSVTDQQLTDLNSGLRRGIYGEATPWLTKGQPIDLEVLAQGTLEGYCLGLPGALPIVANSPGFLCRALTRSLQENVTTRAEWLAGEKHRLGVDTPRPTSDTTVNGPRDSCCRSTASLRRTPVGRRIHTVALLSGVVKLRQGHRGTLRLLTTKAGRTLIRDLKKAGVTRLSAVATVTATTIPGVQSIRNVHVVLRLR